MNLIKFDRDSNGYLNYDAHATEIDTDLIAFCSYLTSEEITLGYLIDPSIKKAAYISGNYYFTTKDDLCVFISEERYSDPDSKPLIILINVFYGILVAFQRMRIHKINSFAMLQEANRYIFTAATITPIVVDPGLGYLYNDTIPQIIVRKLNGLYEWDIINLHKIDDFCIDNTPLKEHLELFCALIIKNYNPGLLATLLRWPSTFGKISKKQRVAYNTIVVSNWYSTITMEPAREADRRIYIEKANVFISVQLSLTKESLIKFLQAWESRLQFCDTFTLIFLGKTLRFFEGEPMATDDSDLRVSNR